MTDTMTGNLNIRKCGLCGKAFVASGGQGVCPECRDEEQDLYNRVRSLIRDYPDRSLHIDEAADILRVPEHKILYLVSRGLVQLAGVHKDLR